MKRNRLILLAVLAVFAAVTLAGCQTGAANADDTASASQQAQTQDSEQAQDAAASANNENAVYGNVTAIDGNSITLEQGTLNQSNLPAGQGGGTPSDIPSGDMAAMPSGEQPSKLPSDSPSDGQRPSMLTLTGKTITITVSDESVIAIRNSDSETTGLAALQVGDTLKVLYADDGTLIQSITLLNGQGNFGGRMGDGAGSEASASAS